MAATITFRPDEDASRALAGLTRDGTPGSTAVRWALVDAARRQAAGTIRAEAEARGGTTRRQSDVTRKPKRLLAHDTAPMQAVGFAEPTASTRFFRPA